MLVAARRTLINLSLDLLEALHVLQVLLEDGHVPHVEIG